MFSVLMNIFKLLKDWQKALLFSFVSYMVVLFFIIVAVVFIMKGFSRNLPVLLGITAGYMFLLFSAMIVARQLFRKRLTEEEEQNSMCLNAHAYKR